MVLTPHAAAGALASRFTRTPVQALAAGVVSHLLLDRIPHRDYSLKAAGGFAVAADSALAAAVLLTTARRRELVGAFGGILPDLICQAERRLGIRVFTPWHHANHTSVQPGPRVGVATQILVLSVTLGQLVRTK